MDAFSALFLVVSFPKIGTSAIQSRATAGVAGSTYIFCLPGSPGACKDAWDEILVHQLDYRYGPCNFVEIMPRLDEHLRRPEGEGRYGLASIKSVIASAGDKPAMLTVSMNCLPATQCEVRVDRSATVCDTNSGGAHPARCDTRDRLRTTTPNPSARSPPAGPSSCAARCASA